MWWWFKGGDPFISTHSDPSYGYVRDGHVGAVCPFPTKYGYIHGVVVVCDGAPFIYIHPDPSMYTSIMAIPAIFPFPTKYGYMYIHGVLMVYGGANFKLILTQVRICP